MNSEKKSPAPFTFPLTSGWNMPTKTILSQDFRIPTITTDIEYVPFERVYYENQPIKKIEYISVPKKTLEYIAVERRITYSPMAQRTAYSPMAQKTAYSPLSVRQNIGQYLTPPKHFVFYPYVTKESHFHSSKFQGIDDIPTEDIDDDEKAKRERLQQEKNEEIKEENLQVVSKFIDILIEKATEPVKDLLEKDLEEGDFNNIAEVHQTDITKTVKSEDEANLDVEEKDFELPKPKQTLENNEENQNALLMRSEILQEEQLQKPDEFPAIIDEDLPDNPKNDDIFVNIIQQESNVPLRISQGIKLTI